MELEVGVDGDDPPVGGRNPPHVSFDSDSFSAEVDSLLPREEVDVSWVLENMKKAATENQISIPEEKMQELFSLVTKVLDPATTGKITKKQIKELTLRSELLAILLDKLRVPNKKKKTPHPFRKSMTTTFQSWQPTPGKWNPTESFVEEGGEGDKQEKEKEEQEKEKEEQEKEKAVQEMRRKRAKTLLFSKSPKYNTATTLIQDDESEDEDYQMWATTLVTVFCFYFSCRRRVKRGKRKRALLKKMKKKKNILFYSKK